MYRLNPFTDQLNCPDVPKSELRVLFTRFIGAVSERTSILAEEVRASDGFQSWSPNFSPESLDPLGAWFVQNVKSRPKTEAEIACDTAKSLGPVLQVTLTDKTFSVAADVGIYFARVLMARYSHLQWKLPLGARSAADYGRPVLEGFRNKVILNPVAVGTTLAWRVLQGQRDAGRLRRAFDVWSGNVEDPRVEAPVHSK